MKTLLDRRLGEIATGCDEDSAEEETKGVWASWVVWFEAGLDRSGESERSA